jgi:hypothetical protein
MNKRISRIAMIVVVFCLAPLTALADDMDTFTISLSPISGTPGSTVDVMGTITNSGPDSLNIDGVTLSVSDPLIATDEDQFLFYENAPPSFSFAPGETTFEFFDLMIDPAATPGVYGTDNSDVFSFFGDYGGSVIEDDVYFTADITNPVTATPEPSSLLLVALGLLILGFWRPVLGKPVRGSTPFKCA